jgi:hypothetical protein
MALPKLHTYDGEPREGWGCVGNEPDVSDFEQSDEHASEYEEDQRVRKLLKGKMDPWWKRMNWKIVWRKFIFVATFFIPLYWTTTAIVSPPQNSPFIGCTILLVAIATVLTYVAVLGVLGLIFIIPPALRTYWKWACDRD